ncbi:hypothetical protein CAPTEDRAFT_124859 [Capitella teleta]|uniref:Sugar phosphate transporter domain-containing protein n=1 Tax=Capitella teleta TaxID=283909 RepID=R7U468_CAPTE|nr:hypothetical protein CAPTEDRAFT_124859 [Capitella teleta]|eukprot:ELT98471.1 hypothetical protein CAPTEDRAFT_124859 [Capitella teleta]
MLKIAGVVSAYWVISISLVFANKYLVGATDSKDLSLFVAWAQCVITVFVVLGLLVFKGLIRGEHAALHKLTLRPAMSRPIVLMTCTFVSMLSFNNLCLRHVAISFYQVARSLTLIFTVVFSVTLLKKSVSRRVLACCLTVACGFFLGIDQESLMGTLSVKGVAFGITSSLFVALNGIFTKKALDVVEGDTLSLTLYSNLNACVLFLPIVILTGQLSTLFSGSQLLDTYFWTFLLCTGALSFCIAWVSAMQIHLTSPVTHHISSNTKAILQTLIAVIYYSESKRPLWWVSVMLVVGGALSYAIVRVHEERKGLQVPSPSEVIVEKAALNGRALANGRIPSKYLH